MSNTNKTIYIYADFSRVNWVTLPSFIHIDIDR